MATRVNRVFDEEDVSRIASTVHRWRADGEDGTGSPYVDVPGFCRAVRLAEISEHGYVLTPGRYVGAEAADDDDQAFNDKMERLTAQLAEQMATGAALDLLIREKLGGLGYGV
jgi:type I restriction enzyme M protein